MRGRERDSRWLIPAAAALGCGVLVWIAAGVAIDDLELAHLARQSSIADILLLKAGPFPLHLLLWKAAASLWPAKPFALVTLCVFTLHVASVFLALALLGRFFESWLALALAAVFALYRPASEALVWAAADSEVLAGFFALLSLWLWMGGAAGRATPARRWLAAGAALLAALGKVSAAPLPLLLLLYTLWFEKGPEAPGERLKKALPPAALALTLALALGLWGALHPGIFGYEGLGRELSLWHALPALGMSALHLFLAIDPRRFLPSPAWGAAFLVAFSLAVALSKDRRLWLGALWIGLLGSISLISRHEAQSRYEYLPALGALLIAGVICERLAAHRRIGRGVALALVVCWGAGQATLYAREAVRIGRCNALNQSARALIGAHAAELRRAEALAVGRAPFRMRHQDVLRYDLGLDLPVRLLPNCPREGRATPCLQYARKIVGGGQCPATDPGKILRWIPARR